MGGESHVGEALDPGLASSYRIDWCDVGESSGLGTEWRGKLGRGRDCFPFTLLALLSLGAVGSFWTMCVCVWSLLYSMLYSDVHIEHLCQKQRWEGRKELVLGGMNGTGRNGPPPLPDGGNFATKCHCSGSVLTAIASLCHKAWQVAGCVVPQSMFHLLTQTLFPHPFAGSLIWACLLSAPCFFEQPLTHAHPCAPHSIGMLPQAAPSLSLLPPSLPLETRALKGQVEGRVLPNPLPSACLATLN